MLRCLDTKNRKCCDFGEHKCDIPISIKGSLKYVDYCISDIVSALNVNGLTTVASCCGHKKIDAVISLKDGRELIIKKELIKNEMD